MVLYFIYFQYFAISILKHAKSNGHGAFGPYDTEQISFIPTGSIAKIVLPSGIRSIPGSKQIRESGCILRSVRGSIFEKSIGNSTSEKISRQFELMPFTDVPVSSDSENTSPQVGLVFTDPLCLSSLTHVYKTQIKQLGRVSFREVSLNAIKMQLSQRQSIIGGGGSGNVSEQVQFGAVEYHLGSGGSTGATVICSNQVSLFKANENDFMLEGGPGAVFKDTRNIIYGHFLYL